MNLVLKGSCIFDSVQEAPYAGYVVVKGNKITSVGKGPVPKAYETGEYQVIDCGDRTVMPGFCDSHVHLLFGALEIDTVNLNLTSSEEEAAQKLFETFKDRDDEWVMGFGWSQYRWENQQFPKKETLDRYFPDRSVIAFNDELHAVWVNSAALDLCGISRETEDPKGGIIYRNEDGSPTGYLLEQPAMELVSDKAMNFTAEKKKALVGKFIEKAHRRGVTAVGDVHVLGICAHEICGALEAEGKLNLRVCFAPPIEWDTSVLAGLKEKYHSDRLSFLGGKGFVDGTPLCYTGLLLEDYSDRPGHRGEALLDSEWLRERAAKLNGMGISMRLHACGDGAVREALDAFAYARKNSESNGEVETDVRNTIEHIENIHPDDLPRFAETCTIASIQPEHMLSEDLENHPIFPILGNERTKLAWPGKSLAAHGAKVVLGTDYPIVDMNPFNTLYRAVCRTMEDDLPREGWNPQEKFTVAEAVKNATASAAYMMKMEDQIGTLEEGKLADIAVLSCNIFQIDPFDLPKVHNTMTIFDGEILYNV